MASNVEDIKSSIADIRKEARTVLYPVEAKSVLGYYGIDVVKGAFSGDDLDQILRSAEKIGFPVTLKLISADLIHKSDAGCVGLNLNNRDEILNAYNDILTNARKANSGARIEGFLVQEMISDGHEVIIGITTDPTFGKIILFGLGGIFVEILKDVAIRKIPISELDAQDMIQEIRGYKILQGARGKEPANLALLHDILLKVSRLGEEIEDITEIDLNPVIVDSHQALVVDPRIIILDRKLASCCELFS
jgi:acyl-CoA synthetase (NDP forming)